MENNNSIIPSGLGILKRDVVCENYDVKMIEQFCAPHPLSQINEENAKAEFSNINKLYNNTMWENEKFWIENESVSGQLNRYGDIAPYTHNRVILKDTKDESLQSTYVNADYITHIWDKSRRENPDFIATQGPIPTTYGHFWRMLWQENVHNIVMLCGLTEDGRLMCDVYWPGKVNETKMYDYLKVTCTEEKKINDFYWTRTFNVVDTRDKTSREVTQWHAVGWPDRKVPRPEYSEYFEDLMKNTLDIKESKPKNPIIVHCSAGVGRTGTFMSLYYLTSLMRYYKANKMLTNPNAGQSVFGTIRALREQRMLSVQTVEQYQYIYLFIKRFASKMMK